MRPQLPHSEAERDCAFPHPLLQKLADQQTLATAGIRQALAPSLILYRATRGALPTDPTPHRCRSAAKWNGWDASWRPQGPMQAPLRDRTDLHGRAVRSQSRQSATPTWRRLGQRRRGARRSTPAEREPLRQMLRHHAGHSALLLRTLGRAGGQGIARYAACRCRLHSHARRKVKRGRA
jgi:hypothetical protein